MKDLYEELVRFYEFQLGTMPHRGAFKQALQAAFSEEDLRIVFLIPFLGPIPMEELEAKAARNDIPAEVLRAAVKRLVRQGLVASYVRADGRICERAPYIALVEIQVRNHEDSPMRQVALQTMNALIEGTATATPTQTPYYRVLPVEAALTGHPTGGHEVVVNAIVPDPRQVLPIDVISEMVKKEPVIALADCYCRVTKQHLGEGCDHPIQTCFYFDELALKQIESGYGRQIDYDEAMAILWDCERQGLVHNVSNCEGQIQTLCNCCPCSCGVIKARSRGRSNTVSPSRYEVVLQADRCVSRGECVQACPLDVIVLQDGGPVFDRARCIGCGQCVASCPEGALSLGLRAQPPRIFRDNAALFEQINSEAMAAFKGLPTASD